MLDTVSVGVTVVDAAGNTGNDSITYMIDVCNSVDQLKNDRASIYPVPSNGIINISKVSENYYLNVIDMTGRLVIANVFVRAGENKT